MKKSLAKKKRLAIKKSPGKKMGNYHIITPHCRSNGLLG